MEEFALSIRTRLAAMFLLAVFALPQVALAAPCHDECSKLAVKVAIGTGNEALANEVYSECVKEQCPA